MLAGKLEPDNGSGDIPKLNISYKPQKISPKSQGIVRQLLHEKIRDAYVHPQVNSTITFSLIILFLSHESLRIHKETN